MVKKKKKIAFFGSRANRERGGSAGTTKCGGGRGRADQACRQRKANRPCGLGRGDGPRGRARDLPTKIPPDRNKVGRDETEERRSEGGATAWKGAGIARCRTHADQPPRSETACETPPLSPPPPHHHTHTPRAPPPSAPFSLAPRLPANAPGSPGAGERNEAAGAPAGLSPARRRVALFFFSFLFARTTRAAAPRGVAGRSETRRARGAAKGKGGRERAREGERE